jgi:hypothetical protein
LEAVSAHWRSRSRGPVSRTPTVAASSVYGGNQYPASLAVDGDPTTSWFSAGAADGPVTTFTWRGTQDQLITRVTIMGNENNATPSFRPHFGYADTEMQVLDASGNVVFDQTYQGPGDNVHDIAATPNVVGRTLRLLLKGREDPGCGGFAELRVEGVPQ